MLIVLLINWTERKENYNNYRFPEAVVKLEEFILNDLSRKYIQIIRDRSDEVYSVLNEIRIGLLKLFSPIIPFFTEKIWLELLENKIVKEESVHLSEFLKVNNKKIDSKLEDEMSYVFEIVEKGLAERDKVKIGLKWPLMTAYVSCGKKISEELFEVMKSQLNVKNVDLKSGGKEISVKLNTEITPSLEAEGYAREISRKVQASRKKAGFVKTDKINLGIIMPIDLMNLLSKDLTNGKMLNLIKVRTNSDDFIIGQYNEKDWKDYKYKFDEKIKDKKIEICFEKV